MTILIDTVPASAGFPQIADAGATVTIPEGAALQLRDNETGDVIDPTTLLAEAQPDGATALTLPNGAQIIIEVASAAADQEGPESNEPEAGPDSSGSDTNGSDAGGSSSAVSIYFDDGFGTRFGQSEDGDFAPLGSADLNIGEPDPNLLALLGETLATLVQANVPTIGLPENTLLEDNELDLDLAALGITGQAVVRNIPLGATLLNDTGEPIEIVDDGSGQATGFAVIQPADYDAGSLTLQPIEHDDHDFQLVIDSSIATFVQPVQLDAVADAPEIEALPSDGNEDNASEADGMWSDAEDAAPNNHGLALSVSLQDLDGSESLTQVTLSSDDLPTGSAWSHDGAVIADGDVLTFDNGGVPLTATASLQGNDLVLTLDQAAAPIQSLETSGLDLGVILPAHRHGSFDIAVQATAQESSPENEVAEVFAVETANLELTVQAVADKPIFAEVAQDPERGHDGRIALDFSLTTPDTDGSEGLKSLTVSNLPAGSALTYQVGGELARVEDGDDGSVDGRISIDLSSLSDGDSGAGFENGKLVSLDASENGIDLRFAPPEDYASDGPISVQVEATTMETAGNVLVFEQSDSIEIQMVVPPAPAADAPSIEAGTLTVAEDNAAEIDGMPGMWADGANNAHGLALSVATDDQDGSGSEYIESIAFAGPVESTGWNDANGAISDGDSLTFANAGDTVTAIAHLDGNGLTLEIVSGPHAAIEILADELAAIFPAHAHGSFAFQVEATVREPADYEGSDQASKTETLNLEIQAVADKPVFSAVDGAPETDDDGSIPLDVTVATPDTDGSEGLSQLKISGLPIDSHVSYQVGGQTVVVADSFDGGEDGMIAIDLSLFSEGDAGVTFENGKVVAVDTSEAGIDLRFLPAPGFETPPETTTMGFGEDTGFSAGLESYSEGGYKLSLGEGFSGDLINIETRLTTPGQPPLVFFTPTALEDGSALTPVVYLLEAESGGRFDLKSFDLVGTDSQPTTEPDVEILITAFDGGSIKDTFIVPPSSAIGTVLLPDSFSAVTHVEITTRLGDGFDDSNEFPYIDNLVFMQADPLEIQIEATSTEGDSSALVPEQSDSVTLAVEVFEPRVADAPVVTSFGQVGAEDRAAQDGSTGTWTDGPTNDTSLKFSVALDDQDGSGSEQIQTITVTAPAEADIQGWLAGSNPIAEGASLTFANGGDTVTAIAHLDGDSLTLEIVSGPHAEIFVDAGELAPVLPAHLHGSFNFLVEATVHEPAAAPGEDTATASRYVNNVVLAVADQPEFSNVDDTPEADDDGSIPLDVTVSTPDTDGSEGLSQLKVSGLPAGSSISYLIGGQTVVVADSQDGNEDGMIALDLSLFSEGDAGVTFENGKIVAVDTSEAGIDLRLLPPAEFETDEVSSIMSFSGFGGALSFQEGGIILAPHADSPEDAQLHFPPVVLGTADVALAITGASDSETGFVPTIYVLQAVDGSAFAFQGFDLISIPTDIAFTVTALLDGVVQAAEVVDSSTPPGAVVLPAAFQDATRVEIVLTTWTEDPDDGVPAPLIDNLAFVESVPLQVEIQATSTEDDPNASVSEQSDAVTVDVVVTTPRAADAPSIQPIGQASLEDLATQDGATGMWVDQPVNRLGLKFTVATDDQDGSGSEYVQSIALSPPTEANLQSWSDANGAIADGDNLTFANGGDTVTAIAHIDGNGLTLEIVSGPHASIEILGGELGAILPSHLHGNFDFQIDATVHEPAANEGDPHATATANLSTIVHAVADKPEFSDVEGSPDAADDGSFALDVTVSTPDTDGSEGLTQLKISGMPQNSHISYQVDGQTVVVADSLDGGEDGMIAIDLSIFSEGDAGVTFENGKIVTVDTSEAGIDLRLTPPPGFETPVQPVALGFADPSSSFGSTTYAEAGFSITGHHEATGVDHEIYTTDYNSTDGDEAMRLIHWAGIGFDYSPVTYSIVSDDGGYFDFLSFDVEYNASLYGYVLTAYDGDTVKDSFVVSHVDVDGTVELPASFELVSRVTFETVAGPLTTEDSSGPLVDNFVLAHASPIAVQIEATTTEMDSGAFVPQQSSSVQVLIENRPDDDVTPEPVADAPSIQVTDTSGLEDNATQDAGIWNDGADNAHGLAFTVSLDDQDGSGSEAVTQIVITAPTGLTVEGWFDPFGPITDGQGTLFPNGGDPFQAIVSIDGDSLTLDIQTPPSGPIVFGPGELGVILPDHLNGSFDFTVEATVQEPAAPTGEQDASTSTTVTLEVDAVADKPLFQSLQTVDKLTESEASDASGANNAGFLADALGTLVAGEALTVGGWISTANSDDVDFYAFTLGADATVTFDIDMGINGGQPVDTQLSLFSQVSGVTTQILLPHHLSSDATERSADDDIGDGALDDSANGANNDPFVSVSLTAGDYLVAVSSFDYDPDYAGANQDTTGIGVGGTTSGDYMLQIRTQVEDLPAYIAGGIPFKVQTPDMDGSEGLSLLTLAVPVGASLSYVGPDGTQTVAEDLDGDGLIDIALGDYDGDTAVSGATVVDGNLVMLDTSSNGIALQLTLPHDFVQPVSGTVTVEIAATTTEAGNPSLIHVAEQTATFQIEVPVADAPVADAPADDDPVDDDPVDDDPVDDDPVGDGLVANAPSIQATDTTVLEDNATESGGMWTDGADNAHGLAFTVSLDDQDGSGSEAITSIVITAPAGLNVEGWFDAFGPITDGQGTLFPNGGDPFQAFLGIDGNSLTLELQTPSSGPIVFGPSELGVILPDHLHGSFDFAVEATIEEPAAAPGDQQASSLATLTLDVEAVAEKPVFENVEYGYYNNGKQIQLGFTVSTADQDGSEGLSELRVSGIPEGFYLEYRSSGFIQVTDADDGATDGTAIIDLTQFTGDQPGTTFSNGKLVALDTHFSDFNLRLVPIDGYTTELPATVMAFGEGFPSLGASYSEGGYTLVALQDFANPGSTVGVADYDGGLGEREFAPGLHNDIPTVYRLSADNDEPFTFQSFDLEGINASAELIVTGYDENGVKDSLTLPNITAPGTIDLPSSFHNLTHVQITTTLAATFPDGALPAVIDNLVMDQVPPLSLTIEVVTTEMQGAIAVAEQTGSLTADVEVQQENRDPVELGDDIVITNYRGGDLMILGRALLANDELPYGGEIVSVEDASSNLTGVSLTAEGDILVNGLPNYSTEGFQTSTFNYTVSDGHRTETATVTIHRETDGNQLDGSGGTNGGNAQSEIYISTFDPPAGGDDPTYPSFVTGSRDDIIFVNDGDQFQVNGGGGVNTIMLGDGPLVDPGSVYEVMLPTLFNGLDNGIAIIDGDSVHSRYGDGIEVWLHGAIPGSSQFDEVWDFAGIDLFGVDLIYAAWGSDFIRSSLGDDVIRGGRGADELDAGEAGGIDFGSDTFLWLNGDLDPTLGGRLDKVLNFSTGTVGAGESGDVLDIADLFPVTMTANTVIADGYLTLETGDFDLGSGDSAADDVKLTIDIDGGGNDVDQEIVLVDLANTILSLGPDTQGIVNSLVDNGNLILEA